MSRSINTQLRDGLTIEYAGHTHRFYRVDVEDTQPTKSRPSQMVYYEIVREDDNEWMGRVTQYIRQDRVMALIRRRYEPEPERIQPFQFVAPLVMHRKKRYDPETEIPQETVPPVWIVTIPKNYVKKYDIRVDDEIQVHIGNTKPNGPIDELYHVSMQASSYIVVLSKLWRMTGMKGDTPEDKGRPRTSAAADTSPYVFRDGDIKTIRIRPHCSPDRNWNLCYWYDRVKSDKKDRYRETSETWDVENRRPKDPDQDEPLPDPVTNFNGY